MTWKTHPMTLLHPRPHQIDSAKTKMSDRYSPPVRWFQLVSEPNRSLNLPRLISPKSVTPSAAELLPPPVSRMVDAVLRPWPQSPRRCEETANNQTAQRRGEQTDPGMDQNHRKGIYGDAITQKKDDDYIRILLQNPGGIGFVTGQRNRESFKIEKLKKFVIHTRQSLLVRLELYQSECLSNLSRSD